MNGSVSVLSSGYLFHDICPGMENSTHGKVETIQGSEEACGGITIQMLSVTDRSLSIPVWKFTYNLVIENDPSMERVTMLLTFSQPMALDKLKVTPPSVSIALKLNAMQCIRTLYAHMSLYRAQLTQSLLAATQV